MQISHRSYTDDPERSATCAAFSASGEWLVLMLSTGEMMIVPTQMLVVRCEHGGPP